MVSVVTGSFVSAFFIPKARSEMVFPWRIRAREAPGTAWVFISAGMDFWSWGMVPSACVSGSFLAWRRGERAGQLMATTAREKAIRAFNFKRGKRASGGFDMGIYDYEFGWVRLGGGAAGGRGGRKKRLGGGGLIVHGRP